MGNALGLTLAWLLADVIPLISSLDPLFGASEKLFAQHILGPVTKSIRCCKYDRVGGQGGRGYNSHLLTSQNFGTSLEPKTNLKFTQFICWDH